MHACEQPDFDVFVSCRGKETKGVISFLKQIKSDVASGVLLCLPPLESSGIQLAPIFAAESTKSSPLTSGSRLCSTLCALEAFRTRHEHYSVTFCTMTSRKSSAVKRLIN